MAEDSRRGSSASSDASVAALVGVGFALVLANSPTLWLLAVVTLFLAVAVYGFFRLALRRQGGTRLSSSAQTAHGARLLVLFLLAFAITRVTPQDEWRMAYAAAGGLIVGIGGLVVLRLESAALARERDEARSPQVSDPDDRIEE